MGVYTLVVSVILVGLGLALVLKWGAAFPETEEGEARANLIVFVGMLILIVGVSGLGWKAGLLTSSLLLHIVIVH